MNSLALGHRKQFAQKRVARNSLFFASGIPRQAGSLAELKMLDRAEIEGDEAKKRLALQDRSKKKCEGLCKEADLPEGNNILEYNTHVLLHPPHPSLLTLGSSLLTLPSHHSFLTPRSPVLAPRTRHPALPASVFDILRLPYQRVYLRPR